MGIQEQLRSFVFSPSSDIGAEEFFRIVNEVGVPPGTKMLKRRVPHTYVNASDGSNMRIEFPFEIYDITESDANKIARSLNVAHVDVFHRSFFK